ncbi:MAG TPA: DDE-type integrase/transposase/recombinase [Gaiellales bacterium]|nr:DDE-type integrase/transposase/recombinase [Gaiellales bacterium]
MVKDGVAVDASLAGLVARVAVGERVNVTAECAALGVSRQTFYKYLQRYRVEGVPGLFVRSRRPVRTRPMIAAEVEDGIVLARKRLFESGLDIGATSVRWWLIDHPEQWWGGDGAPVVPSRATVHRVLVRRGMVTAMPSRRPRRLHRRFARELANELWQMDGFEVGLADRSKVVVIEIVDDHSRLNLACHAAASETGAAAWQAFTDAAARYGLPAQLLTDNGTGFSGRRRGWTSLLEAALAELGVAAITCTVRHPQTCGKVERSHATARRWLARQPQPRSLPELQALLDIYRDVYNSRRHQALDGLTPDQAWTIAAHSGPAGQPLHAPLHVTTHTVSTSGCIGVDGTEIGLGRRHAHGNAAVFRTGNDATIFINGRYTRALTIDRTRRYQPLGA